MDTVILIPVFNNAGTVGNVISRALATGLPILVVDDGSTDGTSRVLDTAARGNGLIILRHKENQGKGSALKSGFMEARKLGFRYAITLDADGQHFPEDIPALLEQKREHTLLVGSRDQRGANPGSSFANRFSNFWFCLYTWTKLPDTQTGYRLYPIEELPPSWLLGARYEAELALLVFCAWKGLQLRPVPVNVAYPEDRVSHFRPGKDFARISWLNTLLLFAAVFYGWPRMLLRKFYYLCEIIGNKREKTDSAYL